jgi:hypothetical protein
VHADNRIIIFGTHTKFRVPTLDINKINGFAPTVTSKHSKGWMDGWMNGWMVGGYKTLLHWVPVP